MIKDCVKRQSYEYTTTLYNISIKLTVDGVLGPHGDIVARLVEMELSQGRDHVIVLQRKMLVHRVLVLPSILRAVWRALVQVIIKTILRVGTFERFALTWARKYYFVLHWQLLIRRIRIQRKRTGMLQLQQQQQQPRQRQRQLNHVI